MIRVNDLVLVTHTLEEMFNMNCYNGNISKCQIGVVTQEGSRTAKLNGEDYGGWMRHTCMIKLIKKPR